MLVDFIEAKSRDASEQWVVMGNSIGGLLTLMLTEQLQEGRKASIRSPYENAKKSDRITLSTEQMFC